MNVRTVNNLLSSSYNIDEVEKIQAILTEAFDRDEKKRFQMETVIGCGVFGLTWKIKCLPSSDPTSTGSSSEPDIRHLVLKTEATLTFGLLDRSSDSLDIFPEYDDIEPMYDRKWLKMLKWAKHVVRDMTPEDDPLAQQFLGRSLNGAEAEYWVYMEWLENGTLGTFIDKASESEVIQVPLPNRLLWRFFLCMTRMCIAMGWPPQQPEGDDPQPVTERAHGPAYGGLSHSDIHSGNVMLGGFMPDDPDKEHWLTPILKLIDFGEMKKLEGEQKEIEKANAANLYAIGYIMLMLVKLDTQWPGHSAQPWRLDPSQPEFLTFGAPLLPDVNGVDPYPTLDPNLRNLVCLCLARESKKRLSPSIMANVAVKCIAERDEKYYRDRGVEGESDESIREILQEILFNAD
ncbi:hypothetical protein GGR50DRAFT_695273 [Xylaria sp. CBS 124048]|nr:hypothetical protein GGR50DRAFT_695273 [Xylaria sp. CBS 124048]